MKRMFLVMAIAFVTILQVSAQDNNRQMTAQQRTEQRIKLMDEKLNLVMTLKASIDRARYIIDNANLYCFLVTDCGWKPDYVWEILNSNVKNEIAERVINKWNQGYAG